MDGQRTDENIPEASLSRLLVRQPAFVRFETCETDGHLRDDTREDGSKTLVKGQRGFPPYDVCASGEKAPRFGLSNIIQTFVKLETVVVVNSLLVLVPTWTTAFAP